jgi:hypothetical protein
MPVQTAALAMLMVPNSKILAENFHRHVKIPCMVAIDTATLIN